MTDIQFLTADGDPDTVVTAASGETLLTVAQNAGQPLEGTCEGQMACSTCHVLVRAVEGAALPPPSEEEEDLLDFAYGATRESRLACQLVLSDDIERLVIQMPGGSVDMSR
ncbi:2Fe-2S ferredoxin [Pacificimonas flava]|uniref:2Fe-2S ferredoxin n=2 Tax=Pacificimonas TaxID=1960290 RepID=A0A219B7A6_9SPHN|nr:MULTISPECIES: 2Fe-2S iron-sulfur cluster-binding protein [Pacificimonas]MBZ6378699.1 2Fe-2S iron-sulfur cluster binding domain-containing protein [Pacificimonas aurantium]OWV34033.1 2Fe-2S ferredoxin [Pacificimonas flava]